MPDYLTAGQKSHFFSSLFDKIPLKSCDVHHYYICLNAAFCHPIGQYNLTQNVRDQLVRVNLDLSSRFFSVENEMELSFTMILVVRFNDAKSCVHHLVHSYI